MTTGPCLCGDPYCPYCGNPAEAKYNEIFDSMIEKINDLDMNYAELLIFEKAGKEAVEHYRNFGGEPPI